MAKTPKGLPSPQNEIISVDKKKIVPWKGNLSTRRKKKFGEDAIEIEVEVIDDRDVSDSVDEDSDPVVENPKERLRDRIINRFPKIKKTLNLIKETWGELEPSHKRLWMIGIVLVSIPLLFFIIALIVIVGAVVYYGSDLLPDSTGNKSILEWVGWLSLILLILVTGFFLVRRMFRKKGKITDGTSKKTQTDILLDGFSAEKWMKEYEKKHYGIGLSRTVKYGVILICIMLVFKPLVMGVLYFIALVVQNIASNF